MHAQRSAIALRQHLEIPTGLRRFHRPKSVLLSGYWKIVGVIARDLQEDSAVWAALICLTSGVQETRAKAQTGCHMLAISHGMAHRLKRCFMRAVHLHIRQQRHVVTRAEL